MTLCLTPAALLKRYVDEHDSSHFNAILASDPGWLTCRLTWVEVWRNLGRRLPVSDEGCLPGRLAAPRRRGCRWAQ